MSGATRADHYHVTTPKSRQQHAASGVTEVNTLTIPGVTPPARHAVVMRTISGGSRRLAVIGAVAAVVLALLAPLSTTAGAAPTAPTAPTAPAAPARAAAATGMIDAGGQVTCQVGASGTLRCGGQNEFGQLGLGDTRDRMNLTQVGEAGQWRSVSTSGGSTCAVTRTNDLYCWGQNSSGQLGVGDAGQQWRPRRVAGLGVWSQVSVGWTSACGIKTDGTLWCWGGNYTGQLGFGNRSGTRSPKKVGISKSWGTVSVGGFHTCGTGTDGVAYCWGKNDLGQLGTGSTATQLAPVRVKGSARYRSIETGWSTSCGLATTGRVNCWGLGDQGQLGWGPTSLTKSGTSTPRRITSDQLFTGLALGDNHACARDTGDRLWCWGGNRYGQLGLGGGAGISAPALVPGDTDFATVVAGWMHTCGATATGSLQCWGNNEEGQLSSGDRVERTAPPGVTARRSLPRKRGPDGKLVVTSFNILGSQHTRPGGGVPHFGPGRIRTEWAADVLRGMGADIVSFQEIQHDQFLQLRTALGDTYSFYPENTTRNPKVVWQAVMWRSSEWELVEAKDIWVPVIGKTRPNPFLKLRNKATGRMIWVMNIHNSSKKTPERQRERNAAMKIELDHIKAQRAKRFPVLFMGDFNEKEVAFCKVTGQTDLEAVNGGSYVGRKCTPPRGMHIDWIFGAPAFRPRGHDYLRSPLTNRITDHTVLTGQYSYPGA